ncbi:hypothetical protein FQR65_LT05969 [Abscondita terminalis]|nr:hypothetical protein FQR65_LT05969 [Abscondita terminalis]
MQLLVVFSLILAAVASHPSRNVLPFRDALGLAPKIISGKPAAVGQFPWQVLNNFKRFDGSFLCGGALVGSRWVLTAAHCAQDALEFKITLGSVRSDGNLEEHAQVIVTDSAFVHPNFDQFYILNDIALINLKTEPVLSDYVKVIALGSENLEAQIGLTVSGWGKTSDATNVASPTLNFVELNTISNAECKLTYGPSINDGSICCVGSPEHSPCNGDSGSPLVQYKDVPYHSGVASFVHEMGCASGNPSGYARTSYFKSWIDETISNN